MKLHKIIEILNTAVISETNDLDIDIELACSGDLMSDVLFFTSPNSILITGLIQPQVVRAAEIVGIKCIVFVQDKRPEKETIELAKEKKIPLLVTPLCMFTACGKLYSEGLQGCPKKSKK